MLMLMLLGAAAGCECTLSMLKWITTTCDGRVIEVGVAPLVIHAWVREPLTASGEQSGSNR